VASENVKEVFMRAALGVLVFLASAALPAQSVSIPVSNWTVPPYGRSSGGLTTMTDFTPPRVFVGVVPCRVVDTRLAPGPYGGPALATNAVRAFDIDNGPCPGLPTGIDAYSLNFGGILPPADGFLTAWPTGSGQPVVSQLNLVGGEVVANAAIVPAGTGGSINVLVNTGPTNIYIDINGYFSETLGSGNYLELDTNSTGFIFRGSNSSTSCDGPCGISVGVASGHAIYGVALEAVDQNYGVYGATFSGNGAAVGVYGYSANANSHGATFENNASGSFVRLASQSGSINFALATFDRISGGSLQIIGSPKMFVAPHPDDPSLQIQYASVEAPTVDVYFRGTGTLVNGIARIDVPDHFRLTAREGTYMTTLTPIDQAVTLRVAQEGPDGILVLGTGNTRFHYVVYAERDEIVGFEPVHRNEMFRPEFLETFGGSDRLPAPTRALLVRNGTLNPDGSYNAETVRSQGWTIPEHPGRPVEHQP
jgi:hypothetical protein